jgi:hypothetical protein
MAGRAVDMKLTVADLAACSSNKSAYIRVELELTISALRT